MDDGINRIYDALTAPFAPELIELKPGATTKDGTRALALAYADTRAYMERLDDVAGPDNWANDYQALPSSAGTVALIARVTILGVTKGDVGESPASDANAWTVAAAQAFKRACAQFGVGRYLYQLPQVWLPYDREKRCIVNPEQAVRNIYRQAGIEGR